MSQVIRGAKYPNHLNVQTAVRWERGTQHNLGFRLVHDGEFQRYTGSGYPRGDEFVRKQHAGGPIHPLTRSGGTGFRLSYDKEDT